MTISFVGDQLFSARCWMWRAVQKDHFWALAQQVRSGDHRRGGELPATDGSRLIHLSLLTGCGHTVHTRDFHIRSCPQRGPESQRKPMLSGTVIAAARARRPRAFYVDGTLDLVRCAASLAQGPTGSAGQRWHGERWASLHHDGSGTTRCRADAAGAAGGARGERASGPDRGRRRRRTLRGAGWLMVRTPRYRCHRAAARRRPRLLGLLGQLDLVSFVASHSVSHRRWCRSTTGHASIEGTLPPLHAADVDAGRAAAGRRHHDRAASRGSSYELNQRSLRTRLSLIAPAEIAERTAARCGDGAARAAASRSGRPTGNNALLLRRSSIPAARYRGGAARRNEALAALTPPPCPGGNIIADQPAVALRHVAAFAESLPGEVGLRHGQRRPHAPDDLLRRRGRGRQMPPGLLRPSRAHCQKMTLR